MPPRAEIPSYRTQVKSVALQLPAKKIFRTVFTVSAGKEQGMKRWMQINLGDNVTQVDIPHPEVGGIDLLPVTGLDNITDPYFFTDEEFFSLDDRFRRVIIA